MARYQLRARGVFDSTTQAILLPDISNAAWRDYLSWVAAGNRPDPIPPVVVRPSFDPVKQAAIIRDYKKMERVRNAKTFEDIKAILMESRL